MLCLLLECYYRENDESGFEHNYGHVLTTNFLTCVITGSGHFTRINATVDIYNVRGILTQSD